MKKTIFIMALMLSALFQGCISTTTSVSASSSLSLSKVRTHARFLTDRMAYELDLSPMQYDDCYEINFDFIYAVAASMNDVVHGYYDAIDGYYRYLDYRNADLRYVLNTQQYIRFMSKEYFYRPIYTSGSSWNFRVYTIYSNTSFYYYDAPTIFRDYRGGHSRSYYSNGYYNNRYQSSGHYSGQWNIVGAPNFRDQRRNDFGTNLRNRNQNPDYNNYNNRNSNNRTADPRYRDNSGNQNTPFINNRGTASGEHRGASTQPSTQSRTQEKTDNGNSSRNTPQGTTTGTRSGNKTPTTSTRGQRTTR